VTTDERLDAILARLDAMMLATNARLDGIHARIDGVHTRVDTVIDGIADLRRDLASLADEYRNHSHPDAA
jgi:hypothetical protein